MESERAPAKRSNPFPAVRDARPTPVEAVLVLAALALHVTLVLSIVQQPFHVNRAAASERSPVFGLHHDMVHRKGPGADFFAVYRAGIWSKHGQSPYRGGLGHLMPYAFAYRYSPVVAGAIGAFLADVPARRAYQQWVWVLEVALALTAAALWISAGPGWFRSFACCLLLLSSPYLLEVHMGQFTFLTLAVVGWALLAFHHARGPVGRTLSMVLYAVGATLKVFPLVAGPAILRRPRGWIYVAVAFGLVALLTAPGLLSDPSNWEQFYARNFRVGLRGFDAGNHGLVYLLRLLAGDIGLGPTRAGFATFSSIWQVMVLGPMACIVLLSRQSDFVVGAGAMLLAHFISYGRAWEHHMSGVLVVVLLVLWRLCAAGDASRREVIAVAAAAAVLALPTPFGLLDADPNRWPVAWRYILPLCKVVPILTVLGVTISQLIRPGFALPWQPAWRIDSNGEVGAPSARPLRRKQRRKSSRSLAKTK